MPRRLSEINRKITHCYVVSIAPCGLATQVEITNKIPNQSYTSSKSKTPASQSRPGGNGWQANKKNSDGTPAEPFIEIGLDNVKGMPNILLTQLLFDGNVDKMEIKFYQGDTQTGVRTARTKDQPIQFQPAVSATKIRIYPVSTIQTDDVYSMTIVVFACPYGTFC